MKEAIIHIGGPKAGSSALQTTLLASRRQLRAHGFAYPDARSGIHNALAAQVCPRPETLFPYYELADPRAAREAIRRDFAVLERRLDRQGDRRLVLSSESLHEVEPDRMPAFRDWLAARAESVRIVCYVRAPTAYASSLVQERVKQGQSLAELADFVPTGRSRAAISPWVETFGRDSVTVRAYDRAQLKDGDIVADFAALIGYDGPLDRSAQYGNPSLSQAATLLIDAAHALPAAERPSAERLGLLKQVPGPKFQLGEAWLARVRAAAEPEIAYLAAEWGIRFPPEPPVAAEAAFGPATLAFIARHLAAG